MTVLELVQAASAGEVPPVSPWWPFANTLLNTLQAVAIAWLINRARRRGD